MHLWRMEQMYPPQITMYTCKDHRHDCLPCDTRMSFREMRECSTTKPTQMQMQTSLKVSNERPPSANHHQQHYSYVLVPDADCGHYLRNFPSRDFHMENESASL